MEAVEERKEELEVNEMGLRLGERGKGYHKGTERYHRTQYNIFFIVF